MDFNIRSLADRQKEANPSSQETSNQHLQGLRNHHTRFTSTSHHVEQSLSASNHLEHSNPPISPDSHHNFDENYDANNPYGFWEASGPPQSIKSKTKLLHPEGYNQNIITLEEQAKLTEIKKIDLNILKHEIKFFGDNSTEMGGTSTKEYKKDMKKLLPHYRIFRDYIQKKDTTTEYDVIESYGALKNLYEEGEIGITARKRVDRIFKKFTPPAGFNVIKL